MANGAIPDGAMATPHTPQPTPATPLFILDTTVTCGAAMVDGGADKFGYLRFSVGFDWIIQK